MNSQLYSIIIILVALSGCNKLHNREVMVKAGSAKTLVKSAKSIDIEIDSLTVNRSRQLGYIHSDKPWLFNLNWTQNEIQMYNLEDQSLYKTLKFPVEGDGGVGHIFSFYVHTLDSIFLFRQSKPTIFLTDTAQMIRKETAYQIPEMHTPAFVHSTHFSALPIVQDGALVVKTRPVDDYNNITNKELSARSLAYKIELNQGTSELFAHRYPNEYLTDGYKLFDFSFAKGRDKWVYSFHSDHNVYYSDSTTSELTPVNAKSKYIDGFQNFDVSGSRMDHYKYFAGAPNYKSIIYDKFRDVYYRFCYPDPKLDTEEEIMKYRFLSKIFSVQILDSDLNVLGETLFDKGPYLSDNVFITEEGIYISKNHPDNPEIKEDFLSFDLFELADIK